MRGEIVPSWGEGGGVGQRGHRSRDVMRRQGGMVPPKMENLGDLVCGRSLMSILAVRWWTGIFVRAIFRKSF